MSAVLARSARATEPLIPEWEALAEAVAEPNPFYEPCVLLPALTELGAGSRIRVLFVRGGTGELIGVFPLHWRACSSAVPLPHYAMWKHRYCFLTTPLLRVGCEEAAVEELLVWLSGAGPAGAMLRVGPHLTDGPFDRAIMSAATRRGDSFRTTRVYERPMVLAAGPYDQYYQATVPRKRRKQLRRLRNRLDELGTVACHTFTAPSEVAAWIPRFIALEHQGWKGREGTSFASGESDRRFLTQATARAAERGQVELRAMTLNDRTIAMALTFRSGPGAFAFKIAYDEEHSDWSPGVQLDLYMFQESFANPAIAWVDSCADPNFPMLDSLWGERRSMRLGEFIRGTRGGTMVGWSATQAQAITAAARARVEALDPTVQQRLRRLARTVRP